MQTQHVMITSFLRDLDRAIDTALRGHALTKEQQEVFINSLVDGQAIRRLPAVDHTVLKQEVERYVRAKFGTSHSTVTISGQMYAISPVLSLGAEQDRLIRENLESRFRPFLIRQIYSYLIGKAFLGQTTTYEAIANEFGLPNKGNQLGSTLSPLLSSIYEFCQEHNQPMLTVIVVRKSGEHKGLPGNGFWSLYNSMVVSTVETIADRREYTRSLQQQVFEYWGGLGQ